MRRCWILSGLWVGGVACGDGGPQQTADSVLRQLGVDTVARSTAVGRLPADAPDGSVVDGVMRLGEVFVAVQARHRALSGSGGAASASSDGRQQGTGRRLVTWNDRNLEMDWSVEDGGLALRYLLTLSFSEFGGGDDVDGFFELQAEPLGPAEGSSGFEIEVDYQDLLVDAEGCGVGGAVELQYSYRGGEVGAPRDNGLVLFTYEGCDGMTVEATR